MCAFFFCCSSLFGAGDLWICLGYRVYILDSSHVVSIHPSPSPLWPLILLIGATVGVAYKIQNFLHIKRTSFSSQIRVQFFWGWGVRLGARDSVVVPPREPFL